MELYWNFQYFTKNYLDLGPRESSLHEAKPATTLDIINKTIDQIFGFGKGLLTFDNILEACSSIISPANAINFHNKTLFGAHANQMAALKSKKGYIGAGRPSIAPHDVNCVLRDVYIPSIPTGWRKICSSVYLLHRRTDGWGSLGNGISRREIGTKDYS